MPLETAEMNNKASSTKAPVPKPRKTNGSTALQNSSEVDPNVLSPNSGLANLECLGHFSSATVSHASALVPAEDSIISTVVTDIEIPCDSNITGSTLPTGEAPPPVSPRLRRVKSENTSTFIPMLQTEGVPLISTTSPLASVPCVSPRLKRLQLDDNSRIRTDSAPTVSPRMHRKQVDHNPRQQEDNLSPMLKTDNASPITSTNGRYLVPGLKGYQQTTIQEYNIKVHQLLTQAW